VVGIAGAPGGAAAGVDATSPTEDDRAVPGAQGTFAGGFATPAPDRALTRRGLLALGAGAVVTVGLRSWEPAWPAGSGSGVSAAAAAGAPATLRRSTYTALAYPRFATGGVSLELVGVGDLPASALAGRDDAFRLVFRAPAADGASLVQGTRRLRHAQLGAFDLFLTPGERGPRWAHVTAVVNRSPGG
jgi:hypothetical protein